MLFRSEHGITHVVHFAAYKAVGESMQQPGRYWRNNVGGTVELVEAVLAEGVRQFVFSSSCSVNGTPAEVPLRESAPVHPESVYAQTKATVETILGWYGVTHGLRTVNLRYFNAAGASADGRIGEDWRYSQNLVPLVMSAAEWEHIERAVVQRAMLLNAVDQHVPPDREALLPQR